MDCPQQVANSASSFLGSAKRSYSIPLHLHVASLSLNASCLAFVSRTGMWSDDIWMGRELYIYAAQPPNPDDPQDPSYDLVAALQAQCASAPLTALFHAPWPIVRVPWPRRTRGTTGAAAGAGISLRVLAPRPEARGRQLRLV